MGRPAAIGLALLVRRFLWGRAIVENFGSCLFPDYWFVCQLAGASVRAVVVVDGLHKAIEGVVAQLALDT
jgi:hypothetical protein